MLIVNVIGCFFIYGGNLFLILYIIDVNGCGLVWVNLLFEDNVEFGFGFCLIVDQYCQCVMCLLSEFVDKLLVELNVVLYVEVMLEDCCEQVVVLCQVLVGVVGVEELLIDVDVLVEKFVWLIGGDGWVYDIGFGGLDYVLSLMENVNILVLDIQCYFNIGGQVLKVILLGVVIKFGEYGKCKVCKDLGVSMMMYGYVYVV